MLSSTSNLIGIGLLCSWGLSLHSLINPCCPCLRWIGNHCNNDGTLRWKISRHGQRSYPTLQLTPSEIGDKIDKILESHESGTSNQLAIENYEYIIPFLDGIR